MRSDLTLRAAVLGALRTVLGPAASAVAITVNNGIVSVAGDVETAGQQTATHLALGRVPGVRALAYGLTVRADAASRR